MYEQKRLWLVAGVLVLVTGWANADVVSIKLTSDALGLGSTALNKDKVVDADIAGTFFTSPVTGEGSVLNVQKSGLAGPGTALDPLLVTVTAKTHLDTLYSLPDPHDYQAGVLYITNENNSLPDGKNEGAGVKAFEVDSSGLRIIDGGRAKIGGSGHVSGGTGPDTFEPDGPNGPPHVDEMVLFNFNPAVPVFADSIAVILSQFNHKVKKKGGLEEDKVDLHVELRSGTTFDRTFFGPSSDPEGIFEPVGSDPEKDSVWLMRFSAISGIGSLDEIAMFSIRAVDDDPNNPKGTAEHFYVTGFTGTEVPEPTTMILLACGGLCMLRKRRRTPRRG